MFVCGLGRNRLLLERHCRETRMEIRSTARNQEHKECTLCHPADCAVHRGRAGNELRVTDCLHLNYTRKGAVCVVREVQGLKLEQLQLRAWQTRGLAESRKHSRAS